MGGESFRLRPAGFERGQWRAFVSYSARRGELDGRVHTSYRLSASQCSENEDEDGSLWGRNWFSREEEGERVRMGSTRWVQR